VTNPLAAEAPAAQVAGDHLVPLGGGRFGVWKHVLVRSPGFPAEGVARLAAPKLARRADTLAAATDASEEEWASYRRLFAEELAALEGEVQEIARGGQFQAAIAWQNHHALRRGVQPLLDRAPGDARNSKYRQREQLVTAYWQRYCVKNDSIGFFGPVGWVRLDGASQTRFQPVDRLLESADVFFEYWAIARLAEALAAQEGMAEWLAPWRAGFVRVEGDRVVLPSQPAVDVTPAVAEVVRRSDGIHPAREIARAVVESGFVADADEVTAILTDLRKRRWISWSLGLPLTPRPEVPLRRVLERIGDAELRERSLAQLDRLESARAKVTEAFDDAQPLLASLEEVDETFSAITSAAPTRKGGKMYGGRTLLYTDCRRALDLDLGAEIVEALAPLDLLLHSGRWLTHHVARVLREELAALHRRLVERDGAPLPMSTLWFEALALLHGSALERFDGVEAELRDRWAQILHCPLDEPRVSYDADVLRERVEALFDAPDAGWPAARHSSPDVMVAAADVDAIRRGDFELVLGELHLALIAFGHHCFVTQHPAPQELLDCLDRDLPPRLLPVLPHEDAERLTIRTHPALVRDTDVLLALHSSVADPKRPNLHATADLFVEELDGSLATRLPSGETHDLLGLFTVLMLRHVIDRFAFLGDEPHTPRVNFDRLVVARETWRVPAGELAFVRKLDEAPRFVEARAWHSRRGLPRHTFVKMPSEQKPFYIDFESPLCVSMLANAVRRLMQTDGGDERLVQITEMLPTLDQLWLRDAEGRGYTAELRLTAVALD
jgi:Lantibiotic dehydratase, N terminus